MNKYILTINGESAGEINRPLSSLEIMLFKIRNDLTFKGTKTTSFYQGINKTEYITYMFTRGSAKEINYE